MIDNLDEAIRLNPSDAQAYAARGMAYDNMDNRIEAEREFGKAKELGYDGPGP